MKGAQIDKNLFGCTYMDGKLQKTKNVKLKFASIKNLPGESNKCLNLLSLDIGFVIPKTQSAPVGYAPSGILIVFTQ